MRKYWSENVMFSLWIQTALDVIDLRFSITIPITERFTETTYPLSDLTKNCIKITARKFRFTPRVSLRRKIFRKLIHWTVYTYIKTISVGITWSLMPTPWLKITSLPRRWTENFANDTVREGLMAGTCAKSHYDDEHTALSWINTTAMLITSNLCTYPFS